MLLAKLFLIILPFQGKMNTWADTTSSTFDPTTDATTSDPTTAATSSSSDPTTTANTSDPTTDATTSDPTTAATSSSSDPTTAATTSATNKSPTTTFHTTPTIILSTVAVDTDTSTTEQTTSASTIGPFIYPPYSTTSTTSSPTATTSSPRVTTLATSSPANPSTDTTTSTTFTAALISDMTTWHPCIESPCENNGTCEITSSGGFWCRCQSPLIDGIFVTHITGALCQKVNTRLIHNPVDNVSPLFGPIAGGTNITLTGRYFSQLAPYAAYIGDTVSANISYSSGTTAFFISPATNKRAIDMRLTIAVLFNSEVRFPRFHYTYRGNPEIDDIYPLDHIISGGTSLNVSGTNLDAVANPILEITQEYIFTVTVGQTQEKKTNTTFYTSLCPLNSSTKLNCLMPKLDIPDEFLPSHRRKRQQDGGLVHDEYGQMTLTDSYHHRLNAIFDEDNELHSIDNVNKKFPIRGTRSVAQSTILSFSGKSKLTFIVGFQLDGYDKYQDIADEFPDKKFSFYVAPSFVTLEEVFGFKPHEPKPIYISGEGFLTGAKMNDYNIRLGISNCTIINIHDNQISCHPNATRPEYHKKDAERCGKELFAIMVSVGYLEHMVGCLRYDMRQRLPLVYIIPISCGGAVLLCVIFIICFCCHKRKRSNDNCHVDQRDEPCVRNVNVCYLEDSFFRPTQPKVGFGDHLHTIERVSQPQTAGGILNVAVPEHTTFI